MKTGMLWRDGSQSPHYQKIKRGMKRFREKYGHDPTYCIVSDDEPVLPEPADVGLESVEASKLVNPNHYLLGPV